MNKIYLERKNRVLIPEEMRNGEFPSFVYAVCFNKNIQSLGYTLSPAAMNVLMFCNKEDISLIYDVVLNTLKEKSGANVKHEPMYKNFPESVKEMSNEQMLHDQFIGYISDYLSHCMNQDFRANIQFDGPEQDRIKLDDKIEYQIVDLGTVADFNAIFTRLMEGNKPLTDQDKNDLTWFLSNVDGAEKAIPEVIMFKETLALVAKIAIENGFSVESLPTKTAVDVLRIVVALSDGDVTLSKPTKFRHFSRKERTVLFSALEKLNENALCEDILRYEEAFKRFAEGTGLTKENRYRNKYPKLVGVMKKIQYGEKIRTYRMRLAEAYDKKDIQKEVELLVKRPGEFARALDKVLRDSFESGNHQFVIDKFKTIADQVPTKTLWTLYTHFMYRNETENVKRFIFPKGDPLHARSIKAIGKSLPKEICNEVCLCIAESILNQYSKRKPIGKVYISNDLKLYKMPFNVRGSSKNAKMLTRGTRLPLKDDTKVVRLFVHWKGRDIDLSALMMNEEFEYKGHVSYTNLRFNQAKGNKYAVVHSGDITHAPNGASEFIDIDLDEFEKCYPEIRYIAMNVYSFSQIPFNNIEECFAGVMERENAQSGEIFEPATVKIKSNLCSGMINMLPLLVDLKRKEVVWIDLSNNINAYNIETSGKSIGLASKAITSAKGPSVFDIVLANVHARGGELVESMYDDEHRPLADVTVFDVDQGIRPVDGDVLVADYL